MCYSLKSSIRTSILSLVSIIYLYSSNIPKYKWLAVTLIGWCSMQGAEAILWYTKPDVSCTLLNKTVTMTIIPIILMMQGLGALYGSFYVISWNQLSDNYKIFFIVYTIITISGILYSRFSNIESTCTTVTKQGHLDWSTNKTNTLLVNSTQCIIYSVIMIGLPLLLLWANKWEVLIYFMVPLLGSIYGLSTDSPGSVWCYFTSFSSIVFAIMLFLHNSIK